MDWKYEINIALSILLLSRYKDVPGAVNVYSNQIAKKILECYANVNELDFDEVMSIVELFRKANTIDVFNVALAELYDFGDKQNIFIKVFESDVVNR